MPLGQSIFVVLTGAVGSGKTWQMLSILKAEYRGQPVAAPGLYLLAEASAEGSAGEVLLDPSKCVVWPVSDSEEAVVAIAKCFPRGGALTLGEAKAAMWAHACAKAEKDKRPKPDKPTPHPTADKLTLRSLVVDGGTSCYNGSRLTNARLLKEDWCRKHKTDIPPQMAGKKDAPWNDERTNSGYAAAQTKLLIGTLNTVCADHRGVVVVVAVNIRPSIEVTKTGGENGAPIEINKTVVGVEPDLGSSVPTMAGIDADGLSPTWSTLAAKANVIWHCVADKPDLRAVTLADINRVAATKAKHGVITQRAVYPGYGAVPWVKRQGGEGPLGVFASVPALWHPDVACAPEVTAISPTPDLGAVLVWAMGQT